MDDDEREKYVRKIFLELDSIPNEKDMEGIRVQPDLNDIRHLTAYIDGPVSTPYHGGIFKVDINLPEMYPFAPPHMRFITRIWHPNISHSSGMIRMATLTADGWSSAMGFKGALLNLRILLYEPDLSYTVEENIMSHYRASPDSFFANAQYYTQQYAMQRDPPPNLATSASRTRTTRMPRHLDEFLL